MDLMQATYARWLDVATRIGFAISLVAFLVYVSGLVEPLVPLQELPRLWSLPASRFVALTGEPTGWGWLALLGKSDFLNLGAVALFGLVTLACYVRIVPILFSAGERLQAYIALAQVLVLVAAAAGFFTGGR
ncbi:hypothetical protein AYO46_07930 [Betaproteobacteria bacterium SCGC AG-212-J23]|nr:hypothetical protein AYO46_07930 [Betaproteobacteria bacterium SCGC AG-212-J23]